jgi:YVTN family beta-propeller protein
MFNSANDFMQRIRSLMFGAAVLLTLGQPSYAVPILYVVNSGSHSLAEVDTTTASVVRLAPAGVGASVVAYNPVNARVYIANWNANSVSVVDASTGDLIADVPVDENPGDLAINAAGTLVYVASNLNVQVIDVATNAVVKSIAVMPFAAKLALDSTGTILYVTNVFGHVIEIDTATNTVVGDIAAPINPSGIAAHPTLPRLFIADQTTNDVVVIDAPSKAILARIPVGQGPAGVVLNPAGTRLYVANVNGHSVSVIDVSTHSVVDTIVVGTVDAGPRDLAMHPTAPILYASLFFGAKIITIDTDTNTVTGEIRTGLYPRVSPFAFGPRASSSPTVAVVEFYNYELKHFFITWNIREIIELDINERIRGWHRTTKWFKAYPSVYPGTEPVCRFYIPPGLGDSHFFGRGVTECAETRTKFPALIEEDPAYMHIHLPTAGICPAGTAPVYRAFNNRPDANHRYAADRAARDEVVAMGWIAEGDGPDLVVMCAPI